MDIYLNSIGVSGVLPNTYWLLSAVLFVSAALVGLWRTQ